MALSITDLKKGAIFQLEGVPYKVLEYSHKMMGRGSSTVTVKIRGLTDGKVLDKTFRGNEPIEPADITNRQVQYLYNQGGTHHFMDTENYEQFELAGEEIAAQSRFLKENDQATAQFFDGRLINIELPKNVPLKVAYAEDAVRGDSSTAITKEATLETGLKIKVPAFIKTGDVISVDTTTGEYRERAKTA